MFFLWISKGFFVDFPGSMAVFQGFMVFFLRFLFVDFQGGQLPSPKKKHPKGTAAVGFDTLPHIHQRQKRAI